MIRPDMLVVCPCGMSSVLFIIIDKIAAVVTTSEKVLPQSLLVSCSKRLKIDQVECAYQTLKIAEVMDATARERYAALSLSPIVTMSCSKRDKLRL